MPSKPCLKHLIALLDSHCRLLMYNSSIGWRTDAQSALEGLDESTKYKNAEP